MPDDTPDLPVPVDGKTPWLRWPRKLRLLDLLKSGLKAVGAGRKLAQGDWQGAIDDALAAYEGIGDLELAQRKAATLVSRALARAIGDLIDDHRHHLGRMAEAPVPSPDDVMIELVLDADFFDHPESLAALGPLQIGLAGWLQEHGRRDEPNGIHHHPTRARTIAERLGEYYEVALAREYRCDPGGYGAIRDLTRLPVTRIEQRINAWRGYHARLMTLPDAPLFDQPFSLREIYQPLRAWWLGKSSEDEDEDEDEDVGEDRYRRVRGEKQVIDATAALHAWLDDPRPEDATRVVSGGPGAGKSSLARMLAADCATVALNPRTAPASLTRAYRVILIDLQRFPLAMDVKEAVSLYGREVCELRVDPFDQPAAGPLLLIFDGLDGLTNREGAGHQAVVRLVEQIFALVRRLNGGTSSGLRALLLCREVVLATLEAYCQEGPRLLHLLPYCISEDEKSTLSGAQELIDVDQRDDWWLRYGELVSERRDYIPIRPTRQYITELTAEPLLNELIASTCANGDSDPAVEQTSLSDIYSSLVERVRRWNCAPGPTNTDAIDGLSPAYRLSRSDFRRCLQAVAVAAWHGDGRLATESQIHLFLGKSLLGKLGAPSTEPSTETQDRIRQLVAAFYFRPHRVAGPKPAFEFTHQSFAEFLLAQHILAFLKRMRRQHNLYLNNPEAKGAWSLERCLVGWVRLFGPEAVDGGAFDFVCDGLQHVMRRPKEDPSTAKVRVGEYQAIIGELIDRVLAEDFPVDAPTREMCWADVLKRSRNAGVALLVVASACWRITQSPTPIKHPYPEAFGGWIRRLQQQRIKDQVPMVHRHLAGLALVDSALSSIDLFGANLQGASLVRADLRRADLRQADLRGVVLEGANLRGADLFKADLSGAILRRIDLRGADLRRVKLEPQADLRHADLRGADLYDADVEGADFQGALIDERTRLPEGFDPDKAGIIRSVSIPLTN